MTQKHLLGINDLSADDIRAYLDRAKYYKDGLEQGNYDATLLQHKVVFTLFFEASTRTATSFKTAVNRLGARVIEWDPGTSALKKGESFSDTLRYLGAMGPDAVIIRHEDYEAPVFAAQYLECPIINAGDSWREHPTQALLDALTIEQHKKTIEGLTIAICGDVAHSRVAASNIGLLTKLGATVRVVAPPTLMPEKFDDDVETHTSLADGLNDADVVMTLRLQKERMEGAAIPDEASYHNDYGITQDALKHAKKDVIVMHPGPMNRGVEIADDVADDPSRSVIFDQAKNGVPTRMAVLDLLLNNR